jgi:hypothetical protein
MSDLQVYSFKRASQYATKDAAEKFDVPYDTVAEINKKHASVAFFSYASCIQSAVTVTGMVKSCDVPRNRYLDQVGFVIKNAK